MNYSEITALDVALAEQILAHLKKHGIVFCFTDKGEFWTREKCQKILSVKNK